MGHELGGQSLLFAANKSGVFAASVCGLEKVTVDEPLLMAAVPAQCYAGAIGNVGTGPYAIDRMSPDRDLGSGGVGRVAPVLQPVGKPGDPKVVRVG